MCILRSLWLSLCVYYDLYGSLYVFTMISIRILWSLFSFMISMVWINNYFSFSFQLDGPNADKVFKDEDDEEPYPAHWSSLINNRKQKQSFPSSIWSLNIIFSCCTICVNLYFNVRDDDDLRAFHSFLRGENKVENSKDESANWIALPNRVGQEQWDLMARWRAQNLAILQQRKNP